MTAADELAREIVDLRRRIHALETAPRAPWTSVRAGGIRYFPDEGDVPHLFIGDLAGTDAVGIWVIDDEEVPSTFVGSSADGKGQIYARSSDVVAAGLNVVDGRMLFPYAVCQWAPGSSVNIDSQGRPTVASGTYTEMLHALLPCTTGRVNTYFFVYAGANQAQVRLTAELYLSGGGTIETVYESAAGITGTTIHQGPWTIPDIDGADPLGQLLHFRIQLRRTSGATPVAASAGSALTSWWPAP